MSCGPLPEEQWAPNQVGGASVWLGGFSWYQYRVLVTCIFLNRIRAVSARPYLEMFLEQYPTPEFAQGRSKSYRCFPFRRLGLPRRAWCLISMARKSVKDPPRPNVLRRKSYQIAGYASDVLIFQE